MSYRTVPIKLLQPTKNKQRLLEDAIERYSQAFALLLENLRQAYPQTTWSRTQVTQALDRSVMKLVDSLDAQPFKDALKVDLSILLARKGSRSYPVLRTEDEDIRRALDGRRSVGKKQLDRLLDRYQAQQPLLFCRYDCKRDYSILKDPETGRYYAKLYLLNRRLAIPSTSGKAVLEDILPPHGLLEAGSTVRYLLLPLDIGAYQLGYLSQVEKGIAVPKSALLLRKKGAYYLHMRLWYPPGERIAAPHYLGIVRGVDSPLQYAICNGDGTLLDAGVLTSDMPLHSGYVHQLANQVVDLGVRYGCQILLENLVGSRDDLQRAECPAGIQTALYNTLADVIAYKASLAGLPQPVRVSAWRIYQRCPVCGTTKKNNRYDQRSLLCVSCGAFRPVVHAAALNLATTLLRYRKTRIKVAYKWTGEKITFTMDSLPISYICPANQFAIQNFCRHLSWILSNPPDPLTKRQRSILNKLRECKHLEEGLAFIQVD